MKIIVVTFNYRVGLYGFLASKEIKEKASLNNGLKDQMKALEWVKKHIKQVCAGPYPSIQSFQRCFISGCA